MKTSWSCPSPYISAARSTAASEVAKLFATLNGVVERPLLFQTAAPAATPWSRWPVAAIASWSWGRATIRCRSLHVNSFDGLRDANRKDIELRLLGLGGRVVFSRCTSRQEAASI